jgi:alkylated DNA nucleotide flippase Atl1
LRGRSAARQVGYALAALRADSGNPRHRVGNATGRISARAAPDRSDSQRILLEAAGIAFGLGGSIDLDRYGIGMQTRAGCAR